MINSALQQGAPRNNEGEWRDLEHAGCLYCDKPWDRVLNTADGAIYLCLDCADRYEARRVAAADPDVKP